MSRNVFVLFEVVSQRGNIASVYIGMPIKGRRLCVTMKAALSIVNQRLIKLYDLVVITAFFRVIRQHILERKDNRFF